MSVLLICGLGFALVIHGSLALWPGADDAEWEQRWEELDDLDRAWLNVASRSRGNRAQLEERGELALAKGIGRREQRRRSKLVLALLPPFFVVAILMVTGVIGDRYAIAVFATFAFAQSLVPYFRERKIKANYREAQERYLASADGGTAPAH